MRKVINSILLRSTTWVLIGFYADKTYAWDVLFGPDEVVFHPGAYIEGRAHDEQMNQTAQQGLASWPIEMQIDAQLVMDWHWRYQLLWESFMDWLDVLEGSIYWLQNEVFMDRLMEMDCQWQVLMQDRRARQAMPDDFAAYNQMAVPRIWGFWHNVRGKLLGDILDTLSSGLDVIGFYRAGFRGGHAVGFGIQKIHTDWVDFTQFFGAYCARPSGVVSLFRLLPGLRTAWQQSGFAESLTGQVVLMMAMFQSIYYYAALLYHLAGDLNTGFILRYTWIEIQRLREALRSKGCPVSVVSAFFEVLYDHTFPQEVIFTAHSGVVPTLKQRIAGRSGPEWKAIQLKIALEELENHP
jgi:hypothetical protein